MSNWDRTQYYILCKKCKGRGSIPTRGQGENYCIKLKVCLSCRGEGKVIGSIRYVNKLNGAVIEAQSGQ